MQRRAVPSGPPAHSSASFTSTSATRPSQNNNKRRGFNRGGGNSGSSGFSSVLVTVVVVVGLFVMSWTFFPAQIMEVEHAMVLEGQKLAGGVGAGSESGANGSGGTSTSKKGGFPKGSPERRVEDWWENAEEQFKDHEDPASARMAAQSSKWVDGEKKLKKKLQFLYERQQKGEMLGVPVLTRWLGEDVPAFLEPGMDEEEWKLTVDRKYAEMREEEEEWKKEMAKIVADRERDLGITTI